MTGTQPAPGAGEHARRALIVDYGGVLTRPMGGAFAAFEQQHGLALGSVIELLRDAYSAGDDHVVARHERGELTETEFELAFAAQLAARGYEGAAEGVVARVFGADGMRPAGPVWDVVAQARAAGVKVAVLSNSWGMSGYPRERLDRCFDEVVISGEVGLRKPDPQIYRLTAERLGVPVDGCAFVDDLDRNVEAAQELGMHAVLHRDDDVTAAELAAFLGVDVTVGDGHVEAGGYSEP